MEIQSGNISSIIFKLVPRNEPGQITLDNQMIQVIRELDGEKSIGVIAKKIGIDIETMEKVVNRLLKYKIIATVIDNAETLREDFFNYLTEQLSLATGPMAQVLIEDALAGFGYKVSNFPKHRALDLVDLLTEKVHRENKKIDFKQTLIEKILSKEV